MEQVRHGGPFWNEGLPELKLSVLFEVAFFAVAEGERDAEGHEADRRDEQDDDALADGALAGGGGGFSGAVAHGAGLAEGWDGG